VVFVRTRGVGLGLPVMVGFGVVGVDARVLFSVLVVGGNAGLLLSALVVCVSRIFSLSLLATARGGASFLGP